MTQADRLLTKTSIMRHEGFSPRPVPDARGSIVLGWGWNPVFTPMTQAQADWMLDQQMDAKAWELGQAWPTFTTCDGPRQRCVLEMSYQIGVRGLLLFAKMLHDIALHNYEAAALEVLNSTLAKQTPARAQDYAALLRETV